MHLCSSAPITLQNWLQKSAKRLLPEVQEKPPVLKVPVSAGAGVPGLPGYPLNYGKIPEKTIWFYYDSGFNPMPTRVIDLCVQTFCANNPDWNFEFVSDDNLLEYLSPDMLPSAFWTWTVKPQKKDMVMANLLALYGGVAADATILNFKSLNILWNRMLNEGADAVMYWYRLVEPWDQADSAAVWFMMGRRDTGIFRRYAQDIKSNFGDGLDVDRVGGNRYLACGTGIMEPIMLEVNSSLPICMNDPNTKVECAASTRNHVRTNGNLNNARVILLDPLDRQHGPQLNLWDALCINQDCKSDSPPLPAQNKELWQDYLARQKNPYFTMIKLFGGGGNFAKKHPELLEPGAENILSRWFKDAGLETTGSLKDRCMKLKQPGDLHL